MSDLHTISSIPCPPNTTPDTSYNNNPSIEGGVGESGQKEAGSEINGLENNVEASGLALPSRGTAHSFAPVWTPEQTALLRELFATELPYSQIATALNGKTQSAFTRNAVIGKAHRIGLQRGARGYKGPRIRKARPEPLGPRPAFKGIAFLDLEPQHCRYPFGEPMLFCGNPRMEDSSYCAHCHAICHTQKPPPVRAVWPFRRAA